MQKGANNYYPRSDWRLIFFGRLLISGWLLLRVTSLPAQGAFNLRLLPLDTTADFLARQEQDMLVSAQQATASLELAEDRYGSGLEGFVTVLAAQRSSLDTQSQLLNIRRQRLDMRIDLHLALGGGLEPEQTEPEILNSDRKDDNS